MGFNVDLWQMLLGVPKAMPPIPEDVSDPRNDPTQTLYGPQDVYDAYRSLRYGEDSVPKPPSIGNPRDIALPVPGPGAPLAPPQKPAIEQYMDSMAAPDTNGLASATAFPSNVNLSPAERERGQVQVTIGGKTYDYGKGESIDDSLKGRMGPMTEPVYAAGANGPVVMGQKQYGGTGGRGSASMVELSDDSTTPMADQLRQEKLQRTSLAAAQAEAEGLAADPFGAGIGRKLGLETDALRERGQFGIEQAVSQKERLAGVIGQQEIQEHAQIDMDGDRNVAMALNQLRSTPKYQNEGLPGRMAMEQDLREKARAYIEQQKREASVALYARFGIQKAPTGLGQDPNAAFASGR